MHVKEWILNHLPTRDRIRHSILHKVLGRSIFSRDLWHMSRRSVSGGLSLGLFVAFTPTIPFPMILTTVGDLCFRVNLPVALAACWITNPLIAVPIYLMAWRLGRWVIFGLPWLEEWLAVQVLAGSVRSFFVECMCPGRI